MEEKVYVRVTDAPFSAAGDGVHNDREEIQSAIDYVFSKGGGTVTLTAGRTFMSSGIFLKSNVSLFFEEGSVLKQVEGTDGYVKPKGDTYVPYTPLVGHNYSDKIKWSHCWYHNYPFIFAPEGSRNFSVRGKGTVSMAEVTDSKNIVKICPIGFYRCSEFEISDVRITNYHSYAMMPFTSSDGLISNVKIDSWSFGNGDGVCLMNCRNIKVTGCDFFTGDDSLYIFSSYKDPRKSEWWSSDEPQPSENIEVDNCNLRSNHCKAFGMILWGIDCPDKEKIQVRNVYVHDCHIETLGNWLYNPYSDRAGYPPVTGVRFENNVIDGIEANFFETKISDLYGFPSSEKMINGDFKDGLCFWAFKTSGKAKCVSKRETPGEELAHCVISWCKNEYAGVYQGLFLRSGKAGYFRLKARSNGEKCRIFVRDTSNDEVIAQVIFDNIEYKYFVLNFNVPCDGNYHLGVENASENGGHAEIADASLGYHPLADGYKSVINDNGKVIFKYNDNLFSRNQLKMYWLTENELEDLTLPEGYSFSHYKGPEDIHVWNLCTTVVYENVNDELRFKREIFDFQDINPFEDVWFLDYKGEHVGTATSFVHLSTGTGDMHWVGIRPDFRGKGLAKYLSYIVQKTLKDRGVPYVSLTTGESRVSAVKSYLTAGFLPVEYAEGMQARWISVMRTYGIKSLQYLNEDATPFKILYI
ncbi:MAG: GNAT family N-acetyltransferase [Clostridiales bacterium]|nr:GNAT family N-acetyltransferase [Clostridiales bacterium]